MSSVELTGVGIAVIVLARLPGDANLAVHVP
jgi:hypothetical protein